jgi:hypothetical protein
VIARKLTEKIYNFVNFLDCNENAYQNEIILFFFEKYDFTISQFILNKELARLLLTKKKISRINSAEILY